MHGSWVESHGAVGRCKGEENVAIKIITVLHRDCLGTADLVGCVIYGTPCAFQCVASGEGGAVDGDACDEGEGVGAEDWGLCEVCGGGGLCRVGGGRLGEEWLNGAGKR